MEKLIEQFLEHLRYERNVSAHTLRNYASDLQAPGHKVRDDGGDHSSISSTIR